MTATDGPAHLLSLKVMRVSRPELASAWQPFYSSSPSFSAHSSASILSLQGTTPLPGHPKTLRDLTDASEFLTLPSSFGSIQLGETFSSCLCVNNETEMEIEVTQARVEMQTVTTKVVLFEMEGAGNMLRSGDTLEHVVHHEIKELGQHVLACTVTYRLPPNSRSVPGASEDAGDPSLQTFRKFYKFAVANPLSVKTKVHIPKSPTAVLSATESEKIFLEVHIQNLTQHAIYFERMRLECTDGWEALDGNLLPDDDGRETSVFSGSMAFLQPQDMRQYVYILTPQNQELTPIVHAPGSIIPLGRLDISWRSSFGEPGRLLTSTLSRRIPIAPVPQPASALPPHLKRTMAGSIPSRPGSPSIGQPNRTGTPPPMPRPGSPGMSRASISGIVQPQSPQQQYALPSPPLPDLEAQLVVRNIPRDAIMVENKFSVAFTVILTSNVPPAGKDHMRRKVKLGIQHLRPRKVQPLVTTSSAIPEALSPRLPSSGFSTPSSSTTTFNYALAHQKILAVSSQSQPPTRDLLHEVDTSEGNANVLPRPYFEGVDELKPSATNNVSFVGPSATFLPAIELNFANAQHKGEGIAKVQVTQEFELSFVALRKGFSTVGGIRILLIEDHLLDSVEEEEDDKKTKSRRASTLKEYDIIGEVWVSA